MYVFVLCLLLTCVTGVVTHWTVVVQAALTQQRESLFRAINNTPMCSYQGFFFFFSLSCTGLPHPVLGPPRPKHKHGSLLFARSKPAEQLSPTATASPSDWEAKFERKKSQPGHVGPLPPASFPPSPSEFSARSKRLVFLSFHQLSKTNAQYHKLFKEVSKDELLRQSQSSLTPL